MLVIDIILLVIIAAFALFGLWFGLIHTLGSLVGTIFGAVLATRYYDILGNWLASFFHWEGNGPQVLAFILAFIIINRIVGFLFWLLEKFFGIFTSLPFVKSLNKLLGLVMGAIEGLVSVGLIIYFINRFPLSAPFMTHLSGSMIAPYAENAARILLPFVPATLKAVQTTIDWAHKSFVEHIETIL